MDEQNMDYKIVERFDDNEEETLFKGENLDDYYKNVYSILIKMLDTGLHQRSLTKLRKDIAEVKDKYEKCGIESHTVVMKIQEASYVLMCRYLESKNIEKAKDFCDSFDNNMEEYIYTKIKKDVPIVIEHNNYYAAMSKIDITEQVNVDVKSIKFWEGIVNIEKPANKYRLPNEWQPLDSFEVQSSSLPGISITSYNYFGLVKVFKIHYDPRSENNKMNQKDLQKLKEYLVRPKVTKNIRIVFDEGIENVYLDLDNVNILCEFSVKLPSTAKTFGGNLFKGSVNISNVDLSNTQVETIDEEAFKDSKVKKIRMPSTLRGIGSNAFNNCTELRELDFAGTDLKVINRNAFTNSGIRRIRLSNELSTVHLEAFSNCKELKMLDLSETKITKIDSGLLTKSGIEKVKLPSSINYIGFGAFSDCKNLKDVDLYNTKIKRFGPYAFCNSSIESIKLPRSLEEVEYEAFARCPNLKKLDFAKTNINNVGAYAFFGSGLQDVKFPQYNFDIDDTAFYKCNFLKKVNIP